MKCVDFGLKLFIVLKQFHSLAPMYYRGSAAAVIVYDITKQVRGSPLRRALILCLKRIKPET